MKKQERNASSKLETSVALTTGFGLMGIFEYNLYSCLDKLGYFEMFNQHTESDWLGQTIPSKSMPDELMSAMYNIGLVSALGGIALFAGGIQLGSYVGRKIKQRIGYKME